MHSKTRTLNSIQLRPRSLDEAFFHEDDPAPWAFTATLPINFKAATVILPNAQKKYFTTTSRPTLGDCEGTRANNILRLKEPKDQEMIQLDYGDSENPALRIFNCSGITHLFEDMQGTIHSVPFSKKREHLILNNEHSQRFNLEDIEALARETLLKRHSNLFRIAFIDRLQSEEQYRSCNPDTKMTTRYQNKVKQ